MGTSDRRDHQTSQKLRKLGFEFDSPVDEYSYQPDSGSTIGGIRGKQEYGITGGISRDGASDTPLPSTLDGLPTEDLDLESAGISEFTEHITRPSDSIEGGKRPSHLFQADPDFLESLIGQRLEAHDAIDASSISISVHDQGVVTIQGHVDTDAQKLRIEEVVSAIPGVTGIDNCLDVERR